MDQKVPGGLGKEVVDDAGIVLALELGLLAFGAVGGEFEPQYDPFYGPKA